MEEKATRGIFPSRRKHLVVRLSRTASDVSSRPGEALSREDALGERGDGSQNASQSAVSLSTRDNETGRRTLLLLRETLQKLAATGGCGKTNGKRCVLNGKLILTSLVKQMIGERSDAVFRKYPPSRFQAEQFGHGPPTAMTVNYFFLCMMYAVPSVSGDLARFMVSLE